MQGRTMTVFRAATLLILLAAAGLAPWGGAAWANEACFGCHGSRDLAAATKSGSVRSLFINQKSFSESAHKALDCTACHSTISVSSHPTGAALTLNEPGSQGPVSCKKCHAKFRSGIHAKITETKGQDAKRCTDCHNPHASTVAPRSSSRDAGYCMGCHSRDMSFTFRDKDSVSLRISPEDLQASVHSKLYCSDCHFGFSADMHPSREFKSRREFSLAASESCRRCHFDKYTKTLESIHYAVLSQGNLKAPVCTDCHGSHSIGPAARERTASAKKCEKCHSAIYQVYAKSVHGSALFNERNQDVPVCADCHRAHNIEDPRSFDYREKVPQMCGNCHANKAIMAKYGLSTAVVTSYLQDFHGVTLTLYGKQKDMGDNSTLKPIAVCIDCHGIHDITKAAGPNSSVLKANLVKRCQKCHAGATEEFPSSWVSHYEPSLKKAPLVFAVNLIYKVFIPFMMAGLVLQILLHIWRYAINR